MDVIKHELYDALVQKYKSELLAYRTTLRVYFENLVAVGEHPTHLKDMDELIEKAACANDKLKMLRLMYKEMYSKL